MSNNLDDALMNSESFANNIRQDLDNLDSMPFDQKKSKITEIEKNLQQLDSKINKMNSDLKSLPPSEREYYESEIRNARSNHSKMVTELRQKNQAMLNDPVYKQNQQLLSNQKRADGLLDNLDEAIKIGNDSVITANNTMSILHEDRQRIQHIDENLMHVHMEAKKGESTAKRMLRRVCFNNFIIWLIVVLLVALLGFSLYWKLRKPKSSNPEPSPPPAPAPTPI
ncbi:t-SNARE VTI1 [Tritrichomonas musculus]|uniref:t-SNARE VTI1 n=1 Tax=Tritrichomonas musculus TaxID=1915356 RepID=A0ABR2KTM2_9EUKA